jgi:hypothetical protein
MNSEKTHIVHFNNYRRIALTIASQEIPGHPAWFILGMSLAHKKDNGSRFIGKCFAEERLMEGLEDRSLPQHMKKMTDEVILKGQNTCTMTNYTPYGTGGYYIVAGLENVKRIITYLRYADRCWSFSKKNSTYHRAFFELPKLWERHIKDFVSPLDRQPRQLRLNFKSKI